MPRALSVRKVTSLCEVIRQEPHTKARQSIGDKSPLHSLTAECDQLRRKFATSFFPSSVSTLSG